MGNFIKGFRRIVDERGTTIAYVSKMSGMSRETVANVYHDRINDVQLKTAHKLAGQSADEFVSFLESKIIESAKSGARVVVIRDRPYSDWMYRNKPSREEEKAISKLLEAGYTLDLLYEEKQFVDIALVIRW